jgi:hypothetical protein
MSVKDLHPEDAKEQYTNFDVSISGVTYKYSEGRISGAAYLLKYSAIF